MNGYEFEKLTSIALNGRPLDKSVEQRAIFGLRKFGDPATSSFINQKISFQKLARVAQLAPQVLLASDFREVTVDKRGLHTDDVNSFFAILDYIENEDTYNKLLETSGLESAQKYMYSRFDQLVNALLDNGNMAAQAQESLQKQIDAFTKSGQVPREMIDKYRDVILAAYPPLENRKPINPVDYNEGFKMEHDKGSLYVYDADLVSASSFTMKEDEGYKPSFWNGSGTSVRGDQINFKENEELGMSVHYGLGSPSINMLTGKISSSFYAKTAHIKPNDAQLEHVAAQMKKTETTTRKLTDKGFELKR